MHVGLWEYLDAYRPALDAAAADDPSLPNATALRWGIAVHPYDAGDPRQNLSASGIYTFATLDENVAAVQCAWLGAAAGVPAAACGDWPQTQVYASEQGWPYNNVTMTKELQVGGPGVTGAMRPDIQVLPACLTHACCCCCRRATSVTRTASLSLRCGLADELEVALPVHGTLLSLPRRCCHPQGVWAVSHNFAQGDGPSSQGDAGDFSLIDYYPEVLRGFANGPRR